MTIAVQFAMRGEAQPLLDRGGFVEVPVESPYGFRFYEGEGVVLAVAGTHPRFKVDSIGSVPASLLTDLIIRRFKPSRVINAGTAGGFERTGGVVGDVYLGAEVVVFHDRRIPLENFEAMGRGHFPVQCDRRLAAQLGLKVGIVSTGDSLDCTPQDAEQLAFLMASVKEMEAAGIAWVCEHHRVPLVLLKAITDIVDHPASTASQFIANYALATMKLTDALVKMLAAFRDSEHEPR